jgi:hypothetical protein
MRKIYWLALPALLGLSACQPTYKRESIKESVKELAKKEYKLDVEVEETGKTLGVRFKVDNLFGEMVADDQLIWKQMDDLMLVLSRITLSSDVPPEFFILDVCDNEHPDTHIVFTRYVEDVKKLMSDALSRNQYLDRLLIEFVIGGKRVEFDPNEMDMVRLMMLTAESGFSGPANPRESAPTISEVDFRDFLAKVAANYTRRLLRETGGLKTRVQLRQVTGSFNNMSNSGKGYFKLLLDIASKPAAPLPPRFMELEVLPVVAREVGDMFKSYKFQDFSAITVAEKNSGKILTVAK